MNLMTQCIKLILLVIRGLGFAETDASLIPVYQTAKGVMIGTTLSPGLSAGEATPSFSAVYALGRSGIVTINRSGTINSHSTFPITISKPAAFRQWNVSPNGKSVAVLDRGSLRIYEARTRLLIHTFQFQRFNKEYVSPIFPDLMVGDGRCVTFSASGQSLAVCLPSPSRREQNSSLAPYGDLYIVKLRSRQIVRVGTGETPCWLSEEVIAAISHDVDYRTELSEVLCYRVIDKKLLLTVSNVQAIARRKDGAEILRPSSVNSLSLIVDKSDRVKVAPGKLKLNKRVLGRFAILSGVEKTSQVDR